MLYAEDEESDVLLLQMGFQLAGVRCQIMSVNDGQKAIQYLAGASPFDDRTQSPFPELVLLDLNLPRENGFEVLAWIRRQQDLSSLPVVIYTSSVLSGDCEKARSLGANDFIFKRSDMKEIAKLAGELACRWLARAQR